MDSKDHMELRHTLELNKSVARQPGMNRLAASKANCKVMALCIRHAHPDVQDRLCFIACSSVFLELVLAGSVLGGSNLGSSFGPPQACVYEKQEACASAPLAPLVPVLGPVLGTST